MNRLAGATEDVWPHDRDTLLTAEQASRYVLVFALIAGLAVTAVGAGTTSACSVAPDDPCLFPTELFIVIPGFVLAAIGIWFASLAKGRSGIAFVVMATMGIGLRMLDSLGAIQGFDGGGEADAYDGLHNQYIHRPTAAGVLSLAICITFLLVCCFNIGVRLRRQPATPWQT